MGTPIYFTKALTAASDNAIATSQTLSGAGNLTLTSSTVSLDTPRQVILTFANDETGHNFTIYGNQRTDGSGNAISETIAGSTAGVVASTKMYGQVTQIAVDAATTGAVKAGTNTVGQSHWVSSNYQIAPSQWSISCTVTGTVNYSLLYTYGDFWSLPVGSTQASVPVSLTDPTINGATTSKDTTFNDPITGWSILINSGTGSVAVSAVQAGISGS